MAVSGTEAAERGDQVLACRCIGQFRERRDGDLDPGQIPFVIPDAQFDQSEPAQELLRLVDHRHALRRHLFAIRNPAAEAGAGRLVPDRQTPVGGQFTDFGLG